MGNLRFLVIFAYYGLYLFWNLPNLHHNKYKFAWSTLQLPRKHHARYWGGTKDDDHWHEQCIWSWLWYPLWLAHSYPISQIISHCNHLMNPIKNKFCLSRQLTVSQALKIGDNNVIESKGGMFASLFNFIFVYLFLQTKMEHSDGTKSLTISNMLYFVV